MKRDEVIAKMFEMAVQITGENSDNWTWEAQTAIWDMCSDWNAEHDESEILMCDYQTEDSEFVNGFMIEDYWFVVEA